VPGFYTYTLRATYTGNPSNFFERTYTAVPVSPMQLNFGQANTLPPARVGSPFSYAFQVAGGTAPYTFAVSPLYPLPPGLTLSTAGVLSGTPTQSGSFGFYAFLSDSAGFGGYVYSQTLIILQPGQTNPLQGNSISLISASVGVPYAGSLLAATSGGVPPVQFAAPEGAAIVGANGVAPYLVGIPDTAGANSFNLTATDSAGQTAVASVYLNVSPLSISPKVPVHGTVGTPYTMALAATGGTAPYTFQLAPSSGMPPGLNLNASGVLSGTPTAPGFFRVNLTVADAASNTLSASYGVVIDLAGQAQGVGMVPADVIYMSYVRTYAAPAPLPIAVTATSGAIPFNAMVGGIPGAALSAVSGSAPATLSLTLDPSGLTTGVYSGVVAVSAPQAANGYVAVPILLTVLDPPPCAYTLNPNAGTVGANGGPGSFDVSTGPACPWTASVSDPAWITVNSGSGPGAGTVHYQVTAPNPGLTPRTGTITAGGQVYTITQFGSSCSLTINPAGTPATAAGGLATVNVTTSNASCAWTASGLSASPATGTGSGTVTFTVPANANPASQVLTATVQLTGGGTAATFTVNQTGISCTVGLSATGASLASSGGAGSVNVTTPAGCAYSTVNGPSWIAVSSGGVGNGPGPVALTYSVAANSTTVGRSGALTIGGQAYTINQDPTPCSVTVDASSMGGPFGTAGGTGTLAVTANGANCTWTASSPAPWATVSPAFGTGNGTIQVTAASNASSTTSRTTNLTVAGQSVAVTQAGTVCGYALGSNTATVPYAGGSGHVTVTAPAVCSWASALDPAAPWLTITSSGAGGTANMVFSAAANLTASARTGTLTVAGQAYTVTQAAAPCNYSLSRSNLTMADGGASDSFMFSTAASGCSAAAVSYSSWLTAGTTGSSDGTSGTVNFTAAPNLGGSARIGTIQFGTQTFTVTQLGAACAYSLAAYGALLGKAGGGASVQGSPSAVGCGTPASTTDPPNIVSLGTLTGPVLNIFTLPYTVGVFNSTMTAVRRMTVTFGGQVYVIKQTSW
jgi:hypothetical protein